MSRMTSDDRRGQWTSVTTHHQQQQQQWRIVCATGNQRTTRLVLNHSGVVDVGSSGSSSSSNSSNSSGRFRPLTAAYELSHDLKAKQLEILEKKYGGPWRSRGAATVIQRAYRQHCLTRNFAKLRWEADEKRLSRRFAEFSHSKTVWSDLASAAGGPGATGAGGGVQGPENMTSSEYDNLMTHSYSSDNMLHHFMSQKSLRTFRQTTTTTITTKLQPIISGLAVSGGSSRKVVEIPVQHLTTTVAGAGGGEESTYLRGGHHVELSDSGESVLSSPQEPSVDLPSECFESVLEKQVVDALDDSFTSDSDNDGDTTPVNEPNKDASSRFTYALSKAADDDGTLRRKTHGALEATDCDDDVITGSADLSKLPAAAAPPEVGGDDDDDCVEMSPDGSPVWKRKSRNLEGLFADVESNSSLVDSPGRSSRASAANSRGSVAGGLSPKSGDRGAERGADQRTRSPKEEEEEEEAGDSAAAAAAAAAPVESIIPSSESLEIMKISDRSRKRAYRIGLNLFNKKPENGIRYLITRSFLDHRPNSVAKFLISRKGLSKQMIGEYLGNLQMPFNMEVLRCFVGQIELSGLQVDVALRKFQSYFRMPGEAQKIERLMEAFATRYCQCNPEHMEDFCSSETVFLLAFAIIMLNTDLHNSNIKPDRKMKVINFIRNLRGIDNGQDINASLLSGIYERIRGCELKPGADHVSHVFRLEQMIFGNKPQLALPHRRLVCYCRMYEVIDPLKRDKMGQHQRELFLFNDVLMITKLFSKKKKKAVLYSFRQMFSLFGMVVHIFESPFYKHGLRLSSSMGGNILIMLNARNEHDRTKFVDDLKESILEITEMEGLRIEEELKKQKFSPASSNFVRYSKDSGVVDVEMLKMAESSVNRLSAPECERLKKSPLSNSLNDISNHNRRGSGISLDSGVASAESESVGGCLEPNRSSRYLGLPLASSSTSPSVPHVP